MNYDFPPDITFIITSGEPPTLKELKEYLKRGGELLRERHTSGASGIETVRGHTYLIDLLIRRLFDDAKGFASGRHGKEIERCSLAAVGGYGRGELNPYSDVDILFLYPSSVNNYHKALTERILYFLWDLGLTVGFSTRSIPECIQAARGDLTARTAMMDARLIAGDEPLFGDMEYRLMKDIAGRGVENFIRDKVLENDSRHKRYGASVYILEPNLKDGEGGLRDIHTALWVAKARYKVGSFRELMMKGIITPREFRFLEKSTEFLFRVRNELHYQSGRKNDQLTFEHQERIARFMRFRDSPHRLAVEGFMRGYYIYARNISMFSRQITKGAVARPERPSLLLRSRRVGEGFSLFHDRLTATSPSLFSDDPPSMMRAFRLSAMHGRPLNDFTGELIRKNLRLVNDQFRTDRGVSDTFLSILKDRKMAYETLQAMHDLRFLGKYIPEFGRTFCRVQHDVYHVYTLDTHSLFTVKEIIDVLEGRYEKEFPLLTGAAREIEHPHIVILAGLLHDVGKGLGKGHSETGARMAADLAARMGLPPLEAELLEFLVRNHLRMVHVSQRRDISDERTVIDFCKAVGDMDRLRMLYLLSFADIRAVGPDVWTPWKGTLLEDLFTHSSNVFHRKIATEKIDERIARKLKEVSAILKGTVSEPYLIRYFKGLPTRYFNAGSAEEIAGHVTMALGLKENPIAARLEEKGEPGYGVLTVCTLDTPGLFSKITGVMAANGMNILNAQIYTMRDGTVLDILSINDPYRKLSEEPGRWAKIREQLIAAIEGRISVDRLLREKKRPASIKEKARPRRPPVVEVDNLVSDTHTVIEIFADDRIGLLYTITSTLSRLGLYVDLAKISTRGDQAADVFYVKDIFGQKVTDEEKIARIKEDIIDRITEGEEKG